MVLWIILTVGLITLVQCQDTVLGRQRYVLFTPGNISLPYYEDFNGTGHEFKVSLNRGINKSETVCVVSFNSTQIPSTTKDYCQVTKEQDHLIFHLSNLSVDDTDIYFFHKEVMYPPPYMSEWDKGRIIHIKEPSCTKPENTIIPDPPLSPFIALGCFALYSIIITTAFVYIVRKGRRTRIQQSEYINVVPRRPRPHLSCAAYATTPAICHSR